MSSAVVVKPDEIIGSHGEREGAGLRIVKRGAINVKLAFVMKLGLNVLLNGEQVVRRMVDSLELVWGKAKRSGAFTRLISRCARP